MEFSNLLPKALFDPYDRPARLYPGLLALVPLPVALVGLYGPSHPWLTGTLSTLSFCGGGYLLGRVSRDAGVRLQDGLFAKWGGAPTTQLLRWRDQRRDPYTKERYHAILSKGLGKSLPTAEQEDADPAGADDLYRAATTWLIAQTRDAKKFPLVFKENVAFGFQRNGLGLRPYGIGVAAICIIWVLIHAKIVDWATPRASAGSVAHLGPPDILALVISVVIILVWVAFITEGAVKRTGFAYAERLLESCDHLGARAAAPGRRTK